MFILFAVPEAAPFAKTGGLADVAGSLPAALRGLGVDARLVLPYYRVVQNQNLPLKKMISGFEVPLGREKLKGNILEGNAEDGVPVYFVEREDFYDRPNLYGNVSGDYYDNLERFSFFSHAVLKLAAHFPIPPDCIHCNDWQTGLIPAIMKGASGWVAGIPTLFAIHNLGYQGIFPAEKFYLTGLPGERFFHPGGMEYWGNVSLLKSGIVYSDLIATVSPTHSLEIQTREFGKGMDGLLRHRSSSLSGILNGINVRAWDPAVDPLLPSAYTPDDTRGKLNCKKSLIRELGMDPTLVHHPLLGVISRLDIQKGIDLIVAAMDAIMGLDAGMIILGIGEDSIQKAIHHACRKYPRRVKFEMRFDDSLAHRILGGADMLLMPSRYEPCGLTQMYAMKYGTIPVVHAVGGLEDTVVSFGLSSAKGNGIKFKPADTGAFMEAIRQGITLYQNKKAWKRLMQNAMRTDFSWERSARSYLKLYRSLVGK
ncbi:MAG: glycogen synthase GlgA [Desulfobacterales bacterium]|jgi:starch synthase|nr:glycogen synthase GlgA [Desulfobacterales bacterium]